MNDIHCLLDWDLFVTMTLEESGRDITEKWNEGFDEWMKNYGSAIQLEIMTRIYTEIRENNESPCQPNTYKISVRLDKAASYGGGYGEFTYLCGKYREFIDE